MVAEPELFLLGAAIAIGLVQLMWSAAAARRRHRAPPAIGGEPGDAGLREYWALKNQNSIDGLPTHILDHNG